LVGENLFANVLVLRIFILVFEGINIWLIYRLTKQWKLPVSRVWWYAFNPLVILELTGNLHFEGLVLTGLLLALYCFGKAKPLLAALSWSWAVGIKLSPVIIGPTWLSAWNSKHRFKFILFSGLSIFVFIFPILNGLENFYQSLRLYQSNFEFNASLYYLIRWVWQGVVGYNPIVYLGPMLNVIALVCIVWVGIYAPSKDPKSLSGNWVWIYFIFLICQTTVHPWYLIPAFGISVLTQNKVFFLWTGLVFLSYGAYAHQDFQENYRLLWVEYGLLGIGLAGIFYKNSFSRRIT
ncbi:MAG: carotene biosynthesis protein, partial [Cyclobacteriaceae bacterium]